MQSAYDQVVDAYVEANHHDPPDFLTIPIQQLAEQAGPSGRILDLGCGTGRDVALFESHGAAVFGGDLSGGMLTFAHQQVASPLVQMDMRLLPFATASFSGVWSCASLLHIPKVEAPAVLTEIGRILQEDGLLILSIQEGNDERWDGGYVEGVQRFFARYGADEMATLLAKHGFEVTATAREAAGSKVWLRFTCTKLGA